MGKREAFPQELGKERTVTQKVEDVTGLIGGALLAGIAFITEPKELLRLIGEHVGIFMIYVLSVIIAIILWPFHALQRFVAQQLVWKIIQVLVDRDKLFEARVVAVIATRVFGGLMYKRYAREEFLEEGLYRVLIKDIGILAKPNPGRRYFYETHAWAKKKEDGHWAILLFVHHNDR